jgi:hypothetical protein
MHMPKPAQAGLLTAVLFAGAARAAQETPQIIVDQFGYRPDADKMAVFADPVKGQNSAHRYAPGETFEVRDNGGKTVFSGKLQQWKNGAMDPISGDRVWHADFSQMKTPGRYVLFDPQNNVQSAAFDIRADVYNAVLKAAVRSYFYQRCGMALEEKFGGNWNRTPCHEVERNAQLLKNSQKSGPARDVSGGWHDAGDHNKYMPFLNNTLWNLLTAYELNPAACTDDYNIPESGNGVPDILDEIKWELDWMLKMQLEDGSVCNRVTTLSYDTGDGPHNDKQPYYYTPPTSWATGVFTASTAHAARVFKPFENKLPGYSKKLQEAALKGWAYLEQTPQRTPANGQDGAGNTASAPAECGPLEDGYLRTYAAAELFKTTGEAKFREYFDAHYKTRVGGAGHHPLIAGWVDPLNATEITRAMILYAATPGHTEAPVDEFRKVLRNTLQTNFLAKRDKEEDPYRGWMLEGHYCWGSNSNKAAWGALPLFGILLKVDPDKDQDYRNMAEQYLHYLHGRNALSLVYLTNMGERGAKLGASRSVMRIFHGWFHNGSPLYDGPDSKFGPAPGFVPGGPNKFYGVKWVAPPYGEPPAKAFKEWNTGWNKEHNANEDPWAINEPAIYYQANYVLLLSSFCAPAK